MALDEPQENEQPMQFNGLGVLVDELARPVLDRATLDYTENKYRKGFTITGTGGYC